MRLVSLFLVVIFFIGCGKKDPPQPPESAVLSFPENNSECTTGVDLNATTSRVEFRWNASNNTDRYVLSATNLNSNITETVNATTTSAKLTLQKGAPYSWFVTSENASTLQKSSSTTWRFYNAGFETSYAPFPAEIVKPTIGSRVFKDLNNDVVLEWSGADIDGDIDGFEIYFSTANPPITLFASPQATATNIKVPVAANTLYYWKVVTKDKEGNTASSPVVDFLAL